MSKLKSIKKWSLITILSLIGIYLTAFFIVKSEVKHYSGKKTTVVNSSQFEIHSGKLAISNVSVLSADCLSMRDSLTVLVDKGKIEYVGNNTKIPDDYYTIDGKKQYLIPGLVDTHTHLYNSKNDLLLYLANGVTQIANMSSWTDNLYLKWRKEANEGALSPKIFVAAGAISSKKGFMSKFKTLFGSHAGYNTPSQAIEAVRMFKNKGYDVIKVYNINKEIYTAVLEEAKKQNISVIGHLPPTISLEDLYKSGQSQLAHIEEITKATMNDFGGLGYTNTNEYLEYLSQNCDAIAKRIKEKNIVVSSTIWIIESIPKQDFNLTNFLKTIPLEYQNPGIIEGSMVHHGWLPGSNRYENPDNTEGEYRKDSELFWKTYVKALHIMTNALIRNGVTITAGTDSNTDGVIAGFSLHDELESLSKVGLSNAQVLQTATLNAGEWMKRNTGKIEEGYDADLVLLKRNPLENIKNTRTINAVITNGKYLDRTTLDEILKAIKEVNNNSREVNIDQYIKN